ncbi:F0F1 ATP synthase subunit gamma [bacterium]|nr:F0F1 ATP synthase subunit gamma [bacterium]
MAKKISELKKEISRINDIKETLKALEKISAANLHNLKILTQRMREYEKALKEIFVDLEEFSHPLFEKPKAKKRLKVLIGQEKGLTGRLISRMIDFFQQNLNENDDIVVLGRQTKKICQELNIKPNFFFLETRKIPNEKDIQELKNFLISQFLTKRYQEVLITYPFFKNFAQQIPREIIFLPINSEKFLRKKNISPFLYPIYEPSKKEVVDYLIKKYLEISFYQKVLEGKLSELTSRVLFVEESAERASNFVRILSRQYFRQKREKATKTLTDLYSYRVI